MKRSLVLFLVLTFLFSLASPGYAIPEEVFSCTNVTEIPQIECEALVALYNSTNGPDWTYNTNWLVTNTPSDWYGIVISDGHVTELQFWNFMLGNNLSGTIPSEIGNLSNLTEINFNDNNLVGTIPPEISNLTILSNLFLASNQLSGTIPPELGTMWRLFQLGLYDNQLTGSIPPQLDGLINLTALSLGKNQLTGSIPPELGNLDQRLFSLSLGDNQLEGSIPVELGELSSLGFLDLSNNFLTGNIPSEIGNLTNLQELRLNNNHLSGDIPTNFVNLVNLVDPGAFYDGGDGLDLDFNLLTIPLDYPDSEDPLHVLLNTKDPEWHLYQGFDQIIGVAGGTLTALDERVEILFPPNALTETITFTFNPLPYPINNISMFTFANNSFELSAEDTTQNPVNQFDLPIIITIKYSDEDLQGNAEESLGFYFWDDLIEMWVDAVTTCQDGEYTRNLIENTFSLPVCHLTEFAVMVPVVYQFVYLPALMR